MSKLDRILIRDDIWFMAAVGIAVLVFFTVLVGIIASFFSSTGETLSRSIDIIYKLGLIGAGLITFCTVAWRGILATQQVDAQRQQLDKLALQITATEENNLAQLLQKGAELLSEEAESKVQAGIATLHALAGAKNSKFATPALDLLANYIATVGSISNQIPTVKSAIQALNDVHASCDRKSSRLFFFQKPFDVDPVPLGEWISFQGAKFANYVGGRFSIEFIYSNNFMPNEYMDVEFDRCLLKNASENKFERCTFNKCKFFQMTSGFSKDNSYFDCNFSYATLDVTTLPDLRPGRNWYLKGHPPSAMDHRHVDWTLYLDERDEE